MRISVSFNCNYKSVEFDEGTATITTGLLDANESVEMAKELISAAEDLLTGEDAAGELCDIREAL